MVYLPTFTIKINHSCRYIYQSHGSYGYGIALVGESPPVCPKIKIKFVNRLVCLDLLHFSPSNAVRHISLDDASILQQQRRCFAASFFGGTAGNAGLLSSKLCGIWIETPPFCW